MIEFSTQFALVTMAVALLIAVVRLVKGPTLPDRVVAMDLVGVEFNAVGNGEAAPTRKAIAVMCRRLGDAGAEDGGQRLGNTALQGITLDTRRHDHVLVSLEGMDGLDQVRIVEKETP